MFILCTFEQVPVRADNETTKACFVLINTSLFVISFEVIFCLYIDVYKYNDGFSLKLYVVKTMILYIKWLMKD